MISEEQQKSVIQKLKPYDPSKIGVFGSYAKGRENDDSDLDLLINLKKRINLFELMNLEKELSSLLGVEVDLVTEGAVNKHMKPYIKKDVIYIFND
jgi:predicted nucleotidyltransferase